MKIKGLAKLLHLKENFKKSGKRKAVFWVILLLVFLLAAAVGIILFKAGGEKKADFPFGNISGGGMTFSMSEGMITASGVTSVGVTAEVFEVENLATELEIEEVYINSEDVITEGTKILRLSEASVADARKELEQALKEADLAYRSGLIEYRQNKITAKYDLDSKILSGEQAKEVYDETVSELQDSVDKARERLNEAREEIAEYQSYVNDDSYRNYFRVDEYQAVYDEILEALIDKMDEWNVSWPQVTGQGSMNIGGTDIHILDETASDGSMSDNTVSGGDAVQSTGPSRDQIEVLATLYDVLEIQLKKIEGAESDYQNALVNASFELQTLELKLPELEKALEEAEKNYQSQVLQAKLTYEKALSNADSAQDDYETAIQQAETTYETLEKNRKDAEENLKLFESSVGDGYFYASGDGTVLRTMVRAGGNLSSESMVFMYSNPGEMTVTVSVSQKDIAGISLDDKVYIQTSEYGGFEGIVENLNPVSDSDSRTNVTYSVIISFVGNTSAVPANESVTVVFGMDEDAIQEAVSMTEESASDKPLPESQLPEGIEMPEGMELPEGGLPFRGDEMPQEGNSPQGGNGWMGMPQGSDRENRIPKK